MNGPFPSVYIETSIISYLCARDREVWRIKDELSEKASRVRKTKAYMMALDQLEAELFKSPYVVHDDAHKALKIRVFRKDRALGVAYLKASVQAVGDINNRLGGLLTFFKVAEAYEDMTELAIEAGVAEEPLYHMLAAAPIPRFNEKADYLAWFDRQLEEFNSHA